ncbi:M20 family metallo-hydrolase [Algoriphagus namhaensis]
MKKLLFASAMLILISAQIFAQELLVNGERLNQTLQKLGTIGKNEMGGSDRIAFSDFDIEGRAYVMTLMKEAGLDVRIDAAGNIIGKRAGKNPDLKKIAFGSHIDEVPNGGDYDGPVGSLSGIEVMKVLNENQYLTNHPLEVIIFSNEEGGVVGSRGMAGFLSKEALEVVSSSGLTMAEGIKKIGGDPENIDLAKASADDYEAYLELHIEQGGNLDRENLDIGIVEGIVAIFWWEFTFQGMANHAGTTPMNQRKDPMLPAAQVILDINRIVKSFEGAQVGTVGKIEAFPGAGNVIPGKVTFNLEIRDLSAEKIQEIYQTIAKRAKEVADTYDVTLSMKSIDVASEPALSDPTIQAHIEESTKKLGLSYRYMPSGAGHDAQEMARFTKIGMIFIPSKDGISHAPEEYSSPEDITNGANVLLQTILRLDRAKED